MTNELVKIEGEAPTLLPKQKEMSSSNFRKIKHFISRKIADIDGFGTETIERLLKNNLINDFSDIYNLHYKDLVDLEKEWLKNQQKI